MIKVYDYLCAECGHYDEVFCEGTVVEVLDCPLCKKETFLKQLSTPAVSMGSEAAAYDQLKKMERKNQDVKERRSSRANGGAGASNILIR